jgi:signal transduction histidine kinase
LHQQLGAWSSTAGERHVYVVDSGGALILYSDLSVSRRGVDVRSNPPIRLLLDGGAGEIRYQSTVSGLERLGFVERVPGVGWGLVVSADVGAGLIDLRARYRNLTLSILFALAAAVVILLLTSRRVVRPVLDLARAVREADRPANVPLAVTAETRRLAEYDDLVRAFEDLAVEVAKVEGELVQAEKTALLGQLASGLAHEMGTPLNVIIGNAQYLLRKAPDDEAAREVLDLVVRQAQRIAAMIRRLLDFSRPAEARLVPLDLGAIVDQTLEMVPRMLRPVAVRLDVDPDTPQILADPKLLEHALLNLVLNACQAMPEGGVLGMVAGPATVAAGSDDGEVCVHVADTGCGIPPECLERVFEPFFTTKAHVGGTGLGLAIVERIVRQHGGRVEVSSLVGRGTVFSVRLYAAAGRGATSGGGAS